MKYGKRVLTIALAVLMASPVAAQDSEAELERQARAAELAAEREEARARAVEARLRETEQRNEARAQAIEAQLREAEEKLAEAAAQVAELSRRRLDGPVAAFQRYIGAGNRPVLGVTIGADDDDGPVEGVTVRGVTPGSAAAEAGLRAGDVLTAVNEESLSAGSPTDANEKLLEFMSGIEEGDILDVEYLRDGETGTVEIQPRPAPSFAFSFGDRNWLGPAAPAAPAAPGVQWFGFHAGGSWGDMEMVALTEELGRYFGTSSGLLVVRAPAEANLKLQDGDVIQRIDGREPTSVSHAMRILGSYQGGETLDIEIMRDKKRETLSIEMPDHRQGRVRRFEFRAPPVEFREEIETKIRESVPGRPDLIRPSTSTRGAGVPYRAF